MRAGVVLAGFAATAAVAGVAWGAQDVALSMTGPVGGDSIAIDGSISGVIAGAPSAPLRLTLRNPGDDARTISRVTATSTGVLIGPATCAGAHLAVRGWRGIVVVPAHGAARVTLRVSVAADLPAACGQATWGLRYTAY